MPATKKSSKKRSSSRAQKSSTKKRGNKRWVAGVTTVSTFPPKGLFTKDAHTIAKSLASKKVWIFPVIWGNTGGGLFIVSLLNDGQGKEL